MKWLRFMGTTAATVVVASAVVISAQSVPRSPRDGFLPQADFLRPVHISGEVNRPGTFPVIDAPTLSELIRMAGGLTANAGTLVILVHFNDNPPLTPLSAAELTELLRPGSRVPAKFTLTRFAISADTRPHVEPQDVLFVPAKNDRL